MEYLFENMIQLDFEMLPNIPRHSQSIFHYTLKSENI